MSAAGADGIGWTQAQSSIIQSLLITEFGTIVEQLFSWYRDDNPHVQATS